MIKSLIVATAFLSSASAFACPNLSGTFSDPANSLKLVIKQGVFSRCSKISIDQGTGTGPTKYAVNGKPQAVPGTTNQMILSWDKNSLVMSSTQMPNMRQVWSLTSKGDLQDEEQLYDGSQWQSEGVESVPRTSK